MNFYEKRNKKSNLTKGELAQMLNTNLEKINELEKGKREIGGQTFEKYIDLTNMTQTQRRLKKLELTEWLRTKGLKNLREEFGYKTQRDLARKLSMSQSVISNIETGVAKYPTLETLLKFYNFFNDDFNRIVEKPKEEIIEEPTKEEETIEEEPCEPSAIDSSKLTMNPHVVEEVHLSNDSNGVTISSDLVNGFTFEQSEEPSDDEEEKWVKVETPTIGSCDITDFVSIKREQYEYMQSQIKRYEKIIDYILKEEK